MEFNCKDELVELLKDYGYSLVILPKENIFPLQILTRADKGGWARLKDVFVTPRLDNSNATIGELFTADSQPLPVPTAGKVVDNVKGKRSSELSLEAATELMINFLNLPESEKNEANKLQIQAALQSAKEISFAFGDDTSETSISHVTLDAFLSDATLQNTVGNTFKELLSNNQLYIITSILRSNSFTMKGRSNEQHISASIDVPKIADVLKGKISGSMDVFELSGLKYKGKIPLVFGFKAVRLLAKKENGKWTFKIKNHDGLALKGDEDFPVDCLQLDNGNFLEVE